MRTLPQTASEYIKKLFLYQAVQESGYQEEDPEKILC